jgi:hypothetical protein
MSWFTRLPGIRASYALRDATATILRLKAEQQRLKAEHEVLNAEYQQLRQARDMAQDVDKLERQVARASPVAPRRLMAIVQEHAEAYRNATPFPHVVLEDFIEPTVLDVVLEEFERMERRGWHHTEKPTEVKWSTEDSTQFGPWTRILIQQLNSGPFLNFLERLTGIDGLIADPHLRGGGLHEIRRGGKLGVHADFNFYPRLRVYRRLNLLIYLNRDWEDAWGGHLELWNGDREPAKSIAPVFNRAVIFDTSNLSYHGHPHPLDCPPDRSRKSIALYYYTVDYPYPEDREAHSTMFLHDH